MNHAPSSDPGPIQPVRVQRHRVHWEASDLDLAEITARRAMSLASQIATGCWFLNPRYTVSSPAPTAEFFRNVLNLRSAWLRTCRQVLGNSGQRRLARRAERRGKLGSLLPDNHEDGAFPDHSTASIQLSGLSPELKREVIEAGQVAKSLGFGGILFVDGRPIPPRTWRLTAERLLGQPHPPHGQRATSPQSPRPGGAQR